MPSRAPRLDGWTVLDHFVNAQFGASDVSTTVRMTEVLSGTLELIHEEFGIQISTTVTTEEQFYLALHVSRLTAEAGGAT